MLVGFYSTFFAFASVFIVTIVILIMVNRKIVSFDSAVLKVMLVVLSLLTLAITSIYGYDFVQLQLGKQRSVGGVCTTKFINGHGTSIDMTEVTLDGKVYNIKSGRYEEIKNGTYYCDLTYLPVTKIISNIVINNE